MCSHPELYNSQASTGPFTSSIADAIVGTIEIVLTVQIFAIAIRIPICSIQKNQSQFSNN